MKHEIETVKLDGQFSKEAVERVDAGNKMLSESRAITAMLQKGKSTGDGEPKTLEITNPYVKSPEKGSDIPKSDHTGESTTKHLVSGGDRK